MGDLFIQWRDRVDVNSLRAVDAYMEELPEFRRAATVPRTRAGMLDFAVFLRERTVALAAEDRAFTGDDLDTMVAAGRERGAMGISPASHRHVLLLHTSLTLREVHEVAKPHDIDSLMHALRWLPPQGLAAQAAYSRGFLQRQETQLRLADRVRVLVELLFAGDVMATDLATSLAMTVPARCVVLVVRIPSIPGHTDLPWTEIVEDLLARYWIPLSWQGSDEFVALVGADGPVSAADRALAVARDFGQLVGLPCAAAAAESDDADELVDTLAQARQVSQVAPLAARPDTVYYRTDLFAELGVTRVPPVDEWLREVGQRLSAGPQLVSTLDAFYRNKMARTLTAAALRIHPRTLDYRLSRVRELTGLDPVSVRGVRILSTTVTRVLAGAWT